MGADVRPRVYVLGKGLLVGLLHGIGGTPRGEHAEEVGANWATGAFAVPARALGVGLAVFFLICLCGVLEGGVEVAFSNFVVVVYESLGFGE